MILIELKTDKLCTASHDAVRALTLSQFEVLLQAVQPANLPNTQNIELSAGNLVINCKTNLCLFADNKWLTLSALQISSLIYLNFTLY